MVKGPKIYCRTKVVPHCLNIVSRAVGWMLRTCLYVGFLSGLLCGLSVDHKADTVSVQPERLSLAYLCSVPSLCHDSRGRRLWHHVSTALAVSVPCGKGMPGPALMLNGFIKISREPWWREWHMCILPPYPKVRDITLQS